MSGDHQVDKSTPLQKASSPWIDLEAKTLARSNAETLNKLSGQKNLSTWNSWVVADLSQEDWIIVHQSPESYQLPKKLEAFVSADLLNDWNEICNYIVEIHNQAVGLRVTQAEVVLAGDERLEWSDRRLREWANEYVDLRIERTKHRRGNLLKQFRHIYDEIVPTLEKIVFRPGSINRCLFSELTDYLPTVLFERTCRPLVDFTFNIKTITAEYHLKSDEHAALYPLIGAYQWHHINDLNELLSLIAAKTPEAQKQVAAEDARSKLQTLIQDIQEMRPFLRLNFRSENVIVELAPNLIASFHWAVNRGVGIILFAPTIREMLIPS